ncbi:hypothetical protein DY000_02060589 [Brassica cretica]|uniref:Uncharacterized protein n=1 Tax=Brassica cretica TaxID=69181 RepID=A0ABQ7B1M9_BRACR|nr:hypothetical protein DY000_02060589 [Brassica cretica]
MANQSSSSTGQRRRIQRFSEIDNAYGEHFQFRPRVSFKSFDDRLQESRLIFSGTVSPIGGYSRRHHSHEATIGYRSLCLRGFVVQGYLDLRNHLLEDVFRVIDNIGWCYTVLHVNPLCPRVVREFISNKPFNEDGALIRGFVYRFSPSVINQLMMTPTVEHSFQWKDVGSVPRKFLMKIPRNISSELPRIGPSKSPSKFSEEVLPRTCLVGMSSE